MRRIILGVAAAACAAAGSAAARQDTPAEFSATAIMRGPEQEPTRSRLYVGDGQLRMELDQRGRAAVMLVDPEAGTVTMLMPEQRMAMELPGAVPGGQDPSRMRARGANPCAGQEDVTCERLGSERVSGFSTQKWRVVPRDGAGQREAMTLWVAPELGYAVRMEDTRGHTWELTDIQVEEQPDSLFQVPADYQRLGSPGR